VHGTAATNAATAAIGMTEDKKPSAQPRAEHTEEVEVETKVSAPERNNNNNNKARGSSSFARLASSSTVKPRTSTSTSNVNNNNRPSSLAAMEQDVQLWNAKKAAKRGSLGDDHAVNGNNNDDNDAMIVSTTARSRSARYSLSGTAAVAAAARERSKQQQQQDNGEPDAASLDMANNRHPGGGTKKKLPPHLQGGMSLQVGRIAGQQPPTTSSQQRQQPGDHFEAQERRLQAKVANSLPGTTLTQTAMVNSSLVDKERRALAKMSGIDTSLQQKPTSLPPRPQSMTNTIADQERIQAKIAGESMAELDNRRVARRASTDHSLMPAALEHVEWAHTSTDRSEDDYLDGNSQEMDWSANVAVTPNLAATPATTLQEEDTEMDQEDLEADEGIEVQPGAYAVRGVGNNHDSESVLDVEDPSELHDSLLDPDSAFFDERGVSTTTLHARTSGGESSRDGASTAPFNDEGYQEDDAAIDPNEAIQAELYDGGELVEDAAVVEDDEELDLKYQRRMRVLQIAVVCLSIVGIICVVISGVNGFGNSSGGRGPPPTIDGWTLVASQAFVPNPEDATLAEFGSGVALSSNGEQVLTTVPGTDPGQALVMTVGDASLEAGGNLTTSWNVQHSLTGLDAQGSKASLAIEDNGDVIAVGYPFHDDISGGVQVFERVEPGSGYESAALLQPFPQGNSSDSGVSGFGYAVDVSSNGVLLAVGAPLFETEPNALNGFVRVYARNPESNIVASSAASSWIPLGEDLVGANSDEMFGWSVSLCDANRIAVGAPFHDTDTGIVRVFEFNAQTQEWRQVGADILGEESLTRFGESVALSNDGTVLVASARGAGFDIGSVKVFRLEEEAQEWVQDSHVFTGERSGDGFGAAIALTGDAGYLAVGAPYDSDFGVDAGIVQVWKDIGQGEWVQEGSNIGGTEGSNMGSSVDITVLPETGVVRVVGGAPAADFDEFIVKAGSFFVYDRQVDE